MVSNALLVALLAVAGSPPQAERIMLFSQKGDVEIRRAGRKLSKRVARLAVKDTIAVPEGGQAEICFAESGKRWQLPSGSEVEVGATGLKSLNPKVKLLSMKSTPRGLRGDSKPMRFAGAIPMGESILAWGPVGWLTEKPQALTWKVSDALATDYVVATVSWVYHGAIPPRRVKADVGTMSMENAVIDAGKVYNFQITLFTPGKTVVVNGRFGVVTASQLKELETARTSIFAGDEPAASKWLSFAECCRTSLLLEEAAKAYRRAAELAGAKGLYDEVIDDMLREFHSPSSGGNL